MSRYTEKTEISYDDYLRLEGLLTIARDGEQQQQRVIASIRGILGESDDNGHAADAVYSGYTARDLLKKSEIVVLPAPESPT